MSEADLLAAIDADPDDDAPRLAHAAWLEANADPERARFIRNQIAGEWANPAPWLAGLPSVPGMAWQCRRGYPEAVTFQSLAAFKKGWPLAATHRVRHVVFSCLRAAKLADEPALASIPSLDFTEVAPAIILAVLRSPRLGPLRHLAVRPWQADPGFLLALAALPALDGLRSLHINHFASLPLQEEHLAALAGSPHLAGLRSLRLEAWLDEGAMRALWRPASLTGLVSLELAKNGISSAASRQAWLDDLGDGAAMPCLERFVLARPSYQGGDAALAIGQAVCWTALRHLDLSGCDVDDAGATALAEAPHLSRLEGLRLGSCDVSDAGAAALAGTRHLRSLSSLDLLHNVIGRAGVEAFGRSASLPALRTLSLAGNPAPKDLIEAVQARFRDGGPPVEETAPAPLPAVAALSAPVIGDADEDGLVRAIWADPWDGLARSAYADWLEEQGAAEHAALLRAPPGAREEAAARLASRLRKDAPCKAKVEFIDGLARAAFPVRTTRSKAFVRDGAAWLRRHHVAEVALEGRTADWTGFFAEEWLEQTRGLRAASSRFDGWEALAGSPRLEGLASLDLGMGCMPEWVFGGSGLRGLARLALGDVVQETMQALSEAPFAPSLRHLVFGRIHDAGRVMFLLADAPALAGLVTLGLERAGMSDACMRMLADARGLGALRNLDVSAGYFGDLGTDALAGSPLLPRLGRLRLSAGRITTPALERLARALPQRGRLVLKEETEAADALAAILGDRLILE